MALISNRFKSRAQKKVKALTKDLSQAITIFIEPTLGNGYKVDCPNCVDSLHGDSSFNLYDDEFLVATVVFADTCCEETITPTSFTRGRCPICKGEGILTCAYSLEIKAHVRYNPRATKYDDLSIGREGSNTIVRVRIDPCQYEKLMVADYIKIKGFKYELNRPPVIKSIGGLETVCEAYLEATETGQRITS